MTSFRYGDSVKLIGQDNTLIIRNAAGDEITLTRHEAKILSGYIKIADWYINRRND